jgi:hypothetical protein
LSRLQRAPPVILAPFQPANPHAQIHSRHHRQLRGHVRALHGAFAGLYFALGVERVFQPDSYQISMLWLGLSIIGSFFMAMFAGWLCVAISKSFRVGQVFALIVLVGSGIMCLSALYRESEGPHVRAGEVGFSDAMERGVSPRWLHFVNPVLTAAGALVGARMKRRNVPSVTT